MPWTSPVVAAVATAVSVAALLVSLKIDSAIGHWVSKPLASTFFICCALASSALESQYGMMILVGLTLSWLGDVLLIPKGAGAAFKAGALSFLGGHVAYAAAFVRLPHDATSLVAGAILVGAAGILLAPRIRAAVPASLSRVVMAYMVVISIMLVLASSASGGTGLPMIFLGALLFYLSDLAVARERFFQNDFINKAVGLPTYYAAQIILAWSCASFV